MGQVAERVPGPATNRSHCQFQIMTVQGGTKRRIFCSPNAPICRIPKSYSRRALTIILSGCVCKAVQAMIGNICACVTAARAIVNVAIVGMDLRQHQTGHRSIEALIFGAGATGSPIKLISKKWCHVD